MICIEILVATRAMVNQGFSRSRAPLRPTPDLGFIRLRLPTPSSAPVR